MGTMIAIWIFAGLTYLFCKQLREWLDEKEQIDANERKIAENAKRWEERKRRPF
jgi:hypothetical protein